MLNTPAGLASMSTSGWRKVNITELRTRTDFENVKTIVIRNCAETAEFNKLGIEFGETVLEVISIVYECYSGKDLPNIPAGHIVFNKIVAHKFSGCMQHVTNVEVENGNCPDLSSAFPNAETLYGSEVTIDPATISSFPGLQIALAENSIIRAGTVVSRTLKVLAVMLPAGPIDLDLTGCSSLSFICMNFVKFPVTLKIGIVECVYITGGLEDSIPTVKLSADFVAHFGTNRVNLELAKDLEVYAGIIEQSIITGGQISGRVLFCYKSEGWFMTIRESGGFAVFSSPGNSWFYLNGKYHASVSDDDMECEIAKDRNYTADADIVYKSRVAARNRGEN